MLRVRQMLLEPACGDVLVVVVVDGVTGDARRRIEPRTSVLNDPLIITPLLIADWRITGGLIPFITNKIWKPWGRGSWPPIVYYETPY